MLASVFVLQPAYAAKGGASAVCQKVGKAIGIATEVALKYEKSDADINNQLAELIELVKKRMPKDFDAGLLGGQGSDHYDPMFVRKLYIAGVADKIMAESKLKNPSRKQIINYAIKEGMSDCMKTPG